MMRGWRASARVCARPRPRVRAVAVRRITDQPEFELPPPGPAGEMSAAVLMACSDMTGLSLGTLAVGLPLVVRALISFPLTMYGQRLHEQDLKETLVGLRRVYKARIDGGLEEVRRVQRELGYSPNMRLLRPAIYPLSVIPLHLFLVWGFRAVPATAWDTWGVTDLAVQDPTGALPTLCGGLLAANFALMLANQPPSPIRTVQLIGCTFVALSMPSAVRILPAGLNLYLAAAIGGSFVQQFLVLFSPVRNAFGLKKYGWAQEQTMLAFDEARRGIGAPPSADAESAAEPRAAADSTDSAAAGSTDSAAAGSTGSAAAGSTDAAAADTTNAAGCTVHSETVPLEVAVGTPMGLKIAVGSKRGLYVRSVTGPALEQGLGKYVGWKLASVNGRDVGSPMSLRSSLQEGNGSHKLTFELHCPLPTEEELAELMKITSDREHAMFVWVQGGGALHMAVQYQERKVKGERMLRLGSYAFVFALVLTVGDIMVKQQLQ